MTAAPGQQIILARAVDKNGEAIANVNREAQVKRLCEFAGALPLNSAWSFTVAKWNRRRTDEQNRYLWVLYGELERATGQAADDWHEFFLGEHFGWNESKLFGRKKLKPKRRSSRLSTVEFAEFVDFILRRASENGIYLPSPNEVTR